MEDVQNSWVTKNVCSPASGLSVTKMRQYNTQAVSHCVSFFVIFSAKMHWRRVTAESFVGDITDVQLAENNMMGCTQGTPNATPTV